VGGKGRSSFCPWRITDNALFALIGNMVRRERERRAGCLRYAERGLRNDSIRQGERGGRGGK
jgi:hypothetical protein